MTVLRLENGTEFPVVTAEVDRTFQKETIAQAYVQRASFDASNITRGSTEAFLLENPSDDRVDAIMGGIIEDLDRQGEQVEVMLESFERYLKYAEPTPNFEEWQNRPDVFVLRQMLNDIPQIAEGEFIDDTGTPGSSSAISTTFSHNTQSKKVRELQEITGAEVQFRTAPSSESFSAYLDYVETLGDDRTSVSASEVSPANQTIKGDFNADKKGGKENVTHLRVIGSSEGRHQPTVNAIPEGDSSFSLGNTNDDSTDTEQNASIVRYTANDWNGAGDTEWFVTSNKDINRLDALEEYAKTLINDIGGSEQGIDVSVVIEGIDVNLGDKLQVVYPEENIDNGLRVVDVTEKWSATGVEYDTTLSTRRASKEDPSEEDRKDIQRYNQSLEGNAVPINAGGGRQPVGPGTNYQMKFYYPSEVYFEHRLNVRVMGLPYRAYSKGSAASAGEIANATPLDTVTSAGETGTVTTTMQYPSLGEETITSDPLLYENGTGSDKFTTYTTEVGTGSITFSDSPELVVTTSAAGGDGGPTLRDGRHSTRQQFDTKPYEAVQIEWEATFKDDGNAVGNREMLVSFNISESPNGTADPDDTNDGDVVEFQRKVSDTGYRSGFSTTTDQIDISTIDAFLYVRVHARSESEDAEPDAEAEVRVKRIEFFETAP